MKRLLPVLASSVFTVFCLSNYVLADELLPENSEKNNTITIRCEEPRPQICTRDYRPVCGQGKDASLDTYSNGCEACADSRVTGYGEGACEGNRSIRTE